MTRLDTETLQQGEQLFAEGRLDEARRLFDQIVARAPDNAEAINDLAVVCLAQGDAEEAERLFRLAAETDPEFADPRISLANYLAADGRLDEAAVPLAEALRLDPADAGLAHRMAALYARIGRNEEARRLWAAPPLSVLRRFIDTLWSTINYWEIVEGLSRRDRLEAVVLGVLTTLDGHGGPQVPFQLIGQEPESGLMVRLDALSEHFYYKNPQSPQLAAQTDDNRETMTPDRPEWTVFRARLFKEINSEGGCLGDYTQTKKVLRSEEFSGKFSFDRSLAYFRKNLGPCDCHVHRGVEV
jgi:hypothetical protein